MSSATRLTHNVPITAASEADDMCFTLAAGCVCRGLSPELKEELSELLGEIDARPADAARIEAQVKERALKALEGALLRPVQVTADCCCCCCLVIPAGAAVIICRRMLPHKDKGVASQYNTRTSYDSC